MKIVSMVNRGYINVTLRLPPSCTIQQEAFRPVQKRQANVLWNL